MNDVRRRAWVWRKILQLFLVAITAVLLLRQSQIGSRFGWPITVVVLMGVVMVIFDLVVRTRYRLGSAEQIFKPEEYRRSGAITYAVAGVTAAYCIGGPWVAALSIAIAGSVDCAAGFVGVYARFGMVPYHQRKSVSGSCAGFLAGTLVGLLWSIGFLPALLLAGLATTVESLPLPVDDDFAIPIVVALCAKTLFVSAVMTPLV